MATLKIAAFSQIKVDLLKRNHLLISILFGILFHYVVLGNLPPASKNRFRQASGLGWFSSPVNVYAKAGQLPLQYGMYSQSLQKSKDSRGIFLRFLSLLSSGWFCQISFRVSSFILPS